MLINADEKGLIRLYEIGCRVAVTSSGNPKAGLPSTRSIAGDFRDASADLY